MDEKTFDTIQILKGVVGVLLMTWWGIGNLFIMPSKYHYVYSVGIPFSVAGYLSAAFYLGIKKQKKNE